LLRKVPTTAVYGQVGNDNRNDAGEEDDELDFVRPGADFKVINPTLQKMFFNPGKI
jgi:hypothetical protein